MPNMGFSDFINLINIHPHYTLAGFLSIHKDDPIHERFASIDENSIYFFLIPWPWFLIKLSFSFLSRDTLLTI